MSWLQWKNNELNETPSNDLKSNSEVSSINEISSREDNKNDNQKSFPNSKPIKKEEAYKGTRKTFDKDLYRDNTKKVSITKGYSEKRQGKLTIARALDNDNVRVRSLASIKRRRETVKKRRRK